MEKFDFEDTVKMTVDRVAGTRNDTCRVFASSGGAAIKGLCRLVREVAKETGMSVQEVICRMAVVIFGPGQKAGDGDTWVRAAEERYDRGSQ